MDRQGGGVGRGWWVPRDGARGQGKTQLLGRVEGQEGNTQSHPAPGIHQGQTPRSTPRPGHTLALPFPKIPQNIYSANSLSEKLGKNCYVLCRCFPGYEDPSERASDDSISCVTKWFCGFLEFSGRVAGWVIPCPVSFLIEPACP